MQDLLEPKLEPQALVAHKRGRVTATVKYREGDGVEIQIPLGPCEMEITGLDVTLSWVDGETHGSTAIPLADYQVYIANGAVVVE